MNPLVREKMRASPKVLGILLALYAMPATAYLSMPNLVHSGQKPAPTVSSFSKRTAIPSKRVPGLLRHSMVATTTMVEKEDGKWKDPPKEILDDAIERAVTLIKASGGSMDSISFGGAWKVAYPTYDRRVFEGTTVTSFTKLLQVRRQMSKISFANAFFFVTREAKSLSRTSSGHGKSILVTASLHPMYTRAVGTSCTCHGRTPCAWSWLDWGATFRNMAQISSLSSPRTRKRWRYTCSRMPRPASSWKPPPRWWCRWRIRVKACLFCWLYVESNQLRIMPF